MSKVYAILHFLTISPTSSCNSDFQKFGVGRVRNGRNYRVRLERLATSGKYDGVRYNVIWQLLNAADYGVAQRRHRVFIVGIKKSRPPDRIWLSTLPSHTHEALLIDQWVTGTYWGDVTVFEET